MKTAVRFLAWFAIAAQVAFVVSWVVAGALTSGYSHSESGVSALAARGMPHAWLVTAGLALLGLGVAALAPGARAVLPRGPAANVAAILFAVAGAGLVVAALARLDCDLAQHGCATRLDAGELSWRTSVHLWASFVTSIALIGTPLALARALWPSPAAVLAAAAGITGVGLLVLGLILYRVGGTPDGIVERVQLLALHIWVVLVAAGILHETRREPRLSRAAPLRPRDFFGSAWAGEGQVQPWPYALGRRFGPRFTFTRTTDWQADDIAIVRDRATLGDGRVEERVRFARIVDPAHIHVTSDDMPDGLDVTIDESGYRTAPYRLLLPLGPLRLVLTCSDDLRLDADGTLHYEVRGRWHGLPAARLSMAGRPVDIAPPSAHRAAVGEG